MATTMLLSAKTQKAMMLGRLLDFYDISRDIIKYEEDKTLNSKTLNKTCAYVDGLVYGSIEAMEAQQAKYIRRADNLESAICAERERQAEEKDRAYEEAMKPETFSTASSVASVFLAGHYQEINMDGRIVSANTARRVAAKLVRMADALDGKL